MDKKEFLNYINENFDISGEAGRLINNILDYADNHLEQNEVYPFLCEILDGTIGLSDREIREVSF
jgi:hypothetical protein